MAANNLGTKELHQAIFRIAKAKIELGMRNFELFLLELRQERVAAKMSELSAEELVVVKRAWAEASAGDGASLRKVVFGSEEMSQFAINFRKSLVVPNHKGNVAIFEYLDDSGSLVKKAFTTEVGVPSHSEELAIDFFNSQNIPKENMKRIYSELEPCELGGHACKAKLLENFPTAQKSFSYHYPGGVDNTLRIKSLNQRAIDLENFLR